MLAVACVLTSCATPVLVLRKAVTDVSLTVEHRILCCAARLSTRAIHPLTFEHFSEDELRADLEADQSA